MNSAVPFWFQSADEGGQPPIPPIPTPDIGRSLRFRGTQFLTNNFANAFQDDVTISFWFKTVAGGSTASNDDIRGTFYRAGNNGNSLYYQWDGTSVGTIQNPKGTALQLTPVLSFKIERVR